MLVKDTLFSKKKLLNCKGRLLDLNIPKVMAVINVTPDSFYKGSRCSTEDEIKKRVDQCINEGADIIDTGAYSSRPGAADIPEHEEIKRLEKALDIIRKQAPDAVISIDTFRAKVAGWAVHNFDVNIINDISGGEMDPDMIDTVAGLNVPFVVMHMKGTPQTMQNNPFYSDVVKEIIAYFSAKTDVLLKAGIKDIIIDPGFGFGKTQEDNFTLLSNLEDFRIFAAPLLVGISRKSMIYKTLGNTPDESLNGTTALHMAALMKGADILRVHDIKEAKEVVTLYGKMMDLS